MIRPVLSALVLAGALSGAAKAGEVCNETSFMLEIATAWRTEAGLAAEGWTRVRPGACEDTPADPSISEQYLYARSTAAYPGGVREWRGGQDVCVDAGDFSFEGLADCAALGLQSRRFRRLGEDERGRVILVEPADFGERAEEAGLQRLLQAAGYDIRLIDGYAGRRTRRQIDAFETDAGRSFGTDRTGLIEALHAAALSRNGEAGLQICNEASAPIAAAVARQRSDTWESRGWWHIAPGTCARPLAGSYSANNVFFYAERINSDPDGPLASPLTGGTQGFCIAPSRFLAEDRENCAGRSYAEARFRGAPEPVDGRGRVALTDLDFEEPIR